VEGGKVPVNTPQGAVSLSVPPNSSSGDLLKLRGKGVQTRPNPGDLLVRLMIVLPRKEDSALTEFIKSWPGRKGEVQR
jgi:DnaJ-class molecular chaperone